MFSISPLKNSDEKCMKNPNQQKILGGSFCKIWNICWLTWKESNFLNVGFSVTEKEKDQLYKYLKS